jgi:hypothetical protein
LESANWSKGNTDSNLNSKESVFLDGSSAFWSSHAMLNSVPSSKGKLFNLGIDFSIIFSLEESFDCLIITSSEEFFDSTFLKVHKSSNFNGIFASILDSF